jgi:hypothetical protein
MHDAMGKQIVEPRREMIMSRLNADVLTTRVADGIAVITLGSAKRIYFDEEMGDALTEALDGFRVPPTFALSS